MLKKTPISAILLVILLFVTYSANAQKDTIAAAKIRHTLIFPIIARSIETGWSFGAAGAFTFHLKSPDSLVTRTSNQQALALYSIRRQFVAAINGSIYLPGEKYILNDQISYSSFPDNFWGIGKIAPDSNKESYNYRQYYIYLHPQRRIGRSLFLGVLYEFQQVMDIHYETGGLFDKEDVTGRKGYHVSGLGLSFTYDTRNNAFSPDKGGMFQASFNHFAPIFGSRYQYTNYVIDMRKFIGLRKKQVLALQLYGFFDAGNVPLRSLATLGGANSMRGYYAGRFRDKNMAVFQAEYRFPLFWRLGAVTFGDFGNVAGKMTDLDFFHVKYSYGAGLRLALDRKERLNLRIDYGKGRGESRGFYFQLGEAF